MRTMDDVRKASRDGHRRLYAQRKAANLCPCCGQPRRLKGSAPVESAGTTTGMEKAARPSAKSAPVVETALCRLCRKPYPRSELDLFGKCKGCRR